MTGGALLGLKKYFAIFLHFFCGFWKILTMAGILTQPRRLMHINRGGHLKATATGSLGQPSRLIPLTVEVGRPPRLMQQLIVAFAW
jgi:hypothetical protein